MLTDWSIGQILQLYERTAQIERLVIARETLLPRSAAQPATVSS